jgi:hypothetical protein
VTRRKPTTNQLLIIQACLRIGVPFFWRSPGTLLVEQSGVDEVVKDVIHQGRKLLGFEGFRMDPSIWPQLDCILSVDTRDDFDDVLARVRSWNQDIWVDMTFDSPD